MPLSPSPFAAALVRQDKTITAPRQFISACCACRHEINMDGARGRKLSKEENMRASHGYCKTCHAAFNKSMKAKNGARP